jgi:two-component system phosphate regulon sensor histidine kinase PhoR
MRESTYLAARMSLIIGIFFSIGFLIIYLLSNLNIGYILALFFAFVFFTFWIIRSHTNTYIYQKIKIIYKTIHDQKRGKPEVRERQQSLPTIENVHHEVMAWSKEYQDQIQELKRLETYRKEYIGNISHELKTPLFNIQGYVSTLLDGGLEDESINKIYLSRTEKSLDRLIKIVEELDTITHLESNTLKLKLVRFNILNLVKEIFDLYEVEANAKNCPLLFNKTYDSPIFVVADRLQIHTLLTNLIGNALKYGIKENPKIKISFFDMNEYILIEITDNGAGISKEDLPRIFERFYRTDKARSRDTGGSGLGLAIVKHIVEAHNQTINVRSTLGLGTTFAFTLQKA